MRSAREERVAPPFILLPVLGSLPGFVSYAVHEATVAPSQHFPATFFVRDCFGDSSCSRENHDLSATRTKIYSLAYWMDFVVWIIVRERGGVGRGGGWEVGGEFFFFSYKPKPLTLLCSPTPPHKKKCRPLSDAVYKQIAINREHDNRTTATVALDLVSVVKKRNVLAWRDRVKLIMLLFFSKINHVALSLIQIIKKKITTETTITTK